jgi:hypothetical protein
MSHITAQGYMAHTVDRKQKLEHRMVWEEHHGTIPDGMHVHHINGDKLDNRIENLEMLPNGDHVSRHAGVLRMEGGEPVEKMCSRCGEWLPISDFYPMEDGGRAGVAGRCKICVSAVWKEAHPRGLKQRRQVYRTMEGVTQKLCSRCGNWLTQDHFGPGKRPGAWRPDCYECRREQWEKNKARAVL